MKKYFLIVAIVCLSLNIFVNDSIGQQTKSRPSDPRNILYFTFGKMKADGPSAHGYQAYCHCNQGNDCPCGFTSWLFTSQRDPRVIANMFSFLVLSHVIVDNTLTITFREKLPALVQNTFEQKEEVELPKEAAESLGYKSVTIIAGGKGEITKGKLMCQVKLGDTCKPRKR